VSYSTSAVKPDYKRDIECVESIYRASTEATKDQICLLSEPLARVNQSEGHEAHWKLLVSVDEDDENDENDSDLLPRGLRGIVNDFFNDSNKFKYSFIETLYNYKTVFIVFVT
jgi:hypothetical protein